MCVDLRQLFFKLCRQVREEISIKIYVGLNIFALIEKVLEHPVACVLVETLEESRTYWHDSLKVSHLERYSRHHSIQFQF